MATEILYVKNNFSPFNLLKYQKNDKYFIIYTGIHEFLALKVLPITYI